MKKFICLGKDRLQQFPDLIFYTTEESYVYFDATHFLQTKGLLGTYGTEEFRREYSPWIKALQTVYGVTAEELFLQHPVNGHELVETALVLLFVAYTDEYYRAALVERMMELEQSGVSISTSRLIMDVGNRFSKEEIKKIMEENNHE